MARLSKTEIYAIRWLNSQGKNIIQIADELKLTEKQVQNTVEKNHVSNKETTIKNATEKANKKNTVTDLIITKTSNKKINSVAIMTKEASEVADANRNSNNNISISKSFKNSIYRPNSKK